MHHDDALAGPFARGLRLMHLRQEARFTRDGKGAAEVLYVYHVRNIAFRLVHFGRFSHFRATGDGSG